MTNGNRRRGKKRDTYNRALHVLARMRRTGLTLTAAAREEHIDPRTVRKYLGTELRGPRLKRKVRPTKGDRRRRDMLIPTALGTSPVVVRGSKQATQLGRYMAAVGKYLHTGDSDSLDEFRGKSIGGHLLITDPDTLSSLAQAGALQLDEIYALPESSS
jgi:lambda repressor-like predicted transcriptional regulator